MKKVNNILIFIISLASLCFLIKDYNYGNNDRLIVDVIIVFVLLIPKIINKIFKFKISDNLYFLYIIFILIAEFFGSIVNLYNTTNWYDLFAHFISGFYTSILSLLTLKIFNLYSNNNKKFNILYMLLFSVALAGIWEYTEFIVDRILNSNIQHNIETGVLDTMEDMLISTLSCIITIGYYCINNKKINKLLDKLAC